MNFSASFLKLMVLKSFVLLGALGAVADEGSSTYYCNSELKWPDWPRREDRCDVKLKRVVVFGRHGARVPIPGSYAEKCWAGDVTKFTCPTRTFLGYTNSPSSGSSPGFTRIRGNHGIIPGHDCIAGSGVRMLLNNGKQIARFYKEALGIEDIPNAVHLMIRSTDVPRVIQSATAFMIGMFPTLNVSSPPLDMIIPDQASDPMVPKPSITSSQESRSSITSAASLYRDPRAMSSLYSYLLDCLTAHFCPTVPGDDKSVPQGLEPGSKMLADVFSNGTFWFNGKYGTAPKLMKLAYGPMIDDLLTDLKMTFRKFSLYMGHDSGPTNLILDALGLTWLDTHNKCADYWPPFGAMLVMEFYSDDQVRWIYNGRVASMDAIKDCQSKPTCSFELMRKHLVGLVPSKQDCERERELTAHLRG